MDGHRASVVSAFTITMMFFDGFVLWTAQVFLYLHQWRRVLRFRRRLGWWPNLARPTDYSDRMFWRKAVDRNPLFIRCSDKLDAKDYVRARCPDAFLARTLWSGDDSDKIPDEALRGRVWVKASHGYNLNREIGDGPVDRAALKAETERWLATRHGLEFQEWAYLQLRPRLLVEAAVVPARGELWEFEIRVAAGRFVFGSMVRRNKRSGMWRIYLDRDGRPPTGETAGERFGPGGFPGDLDFLPAYQEAIRLAERIGGELDYARIDFMWDGERVFAGEITIYPSSGLSTIANPEVNRRIVETWRLEDSDFLRRPQPWPVSLYTGALRRALARTKAAPDAG